MSDTVRARLEALLPDESFSSDDKVYIEKVGVRVGPPGSSTRESSEAIALAIEQGQELGDDDRIVVESRRVGIDTPIPVPGLSDSFDGTELNRSVWGLVGGLATLDGQGHLQFPGTRGSHWVRLALTPPFAGKTAQVEWEQIANAASGNRQAALTVSRMADPAQQYVRLSQAGGSIFLMSYSWGGTPKSAPYSASAMRHWRLRDDDGTIRAETSPDGQAWTERLSVGRPSWMSDGCRYDVISGVYVGGESAASTLVDNFRLS